jgi:hypothetical protein
MWALRMCSGWLIVIGRREAGPSHLARPIIITFDNGVNTGKAKDEFITSSGSPSGEGAPSPEGERIINSKILEDIPTFFFILQTPERVLHKL